MQLLNEAQTGGSDVSHTIFQIFPSNTDTNRLLSHCHFEPVSRWALDLLLCQYEAEQANAAADFFHKISGMRGAASLRGYLFERQVLKYLDDIDTDRGLSIRGLSSSDHTTWTYRRPIGRVTFQEPAVIDTIKNAVESSTSLHLVPSAPNFPAVDSIVYHPNEALTCVQITTSSDHPISVPGLERIQGWLKRGTPPAGLRPNKTRPWRFLFIVPPDMASTFTLQELKDDSLNGEWAGKVDQYVLGWKEQDFFGRS